jgi:SpoVK/Ycf46/Vps4 family AAA+-type ATPase
VKYSGSLISKRLTNVTQGSEQAINSIRSQLLICLDIFKGIVIFATDLVSNYGHGFDNTVKHIYFPIPDRETRQLLWKRHLPDKLPVGKLSLESLADSCEGLVGREIKMAVIDAAGAAARAKQIRGSQMDFIAAIERIKVARQQKEPQKSSAFGLSHDNLPASAPKAGAHRFLTHHPEENRIPSSPHSPCVKRSCGWSILPRRR